MIGYIVYNEKFVGKTFKDFIAVNTYESVMFNIAITVYTLEEFTVVFNNGNIRYDDGERVYIVDTKEQGFILV